MDATTPIHAETREIAIRASDVSKVFASGDGVHQLDVEIPSGSIFGFIGPSGSGKTTAVRMFTGAIEPTGGEISVLGKSPIEFDKRTRSLIGYMPQLSVLYQNLSVDDNLQFFAALYGMSRRASAGRRNEVLDFVDLEEHRTKRVSQISGGMQRRLSLASTLVHDPTMLFLDEPTAGIDPVLRRKFWDRFTDMRDEGKTLFVTTQYVSEAAYCDYVGVLADGRLLTVETPDGLRRAAFGGDIVHVELVDPLSASLIDEIRSVVGSESCEAYSMRGLRIVVDEAAVELPKLTTWLSSNGIGVTQAEEHLPPFDDVFVELVERFRGDGDEEVAGARIVA